MECCWSVFWTTPDAFDVTTNVTSIEETSTYTASITSDFGCGTIVSEPLVVPVYLP